MPLYFAEVYFNRGFKLGYELITAAMSGGFPPGVTLKAGPWASNEEAKIMLVLDIQDHSLTFGPFSSAVAPSIFAKRRLTPIVEWSAVEKALKES